MEESERKPHLSQYGSVDPAPPANEGNVGLWLDILQNEKLPMFERMRAVFSLRNERSDEACLALCQGFTSSSALLRHELAYVLGQMQNTVALPTLTERLADPAEHVMVRHEAAEAMGAIGERTVIPVLQQFSKDPLPEVSESCIVALDLLAWVSGSEFETTES